MIDDGGWYGETVVGEVGGVHGAQVGRVAGAAAWGIVVLGEGV